MQNVKNKSDYNGTLQVKPTEGAKYEKPIGKIELWTQGHPTGNQPDLKGYILIGEDYFQVSLWQTKEKQK